MRRKKIHTSYKYILGFCATFAVCNLFIEKIAVNNEGKNVPEMQNINQAQSYNSTIKEEKIEKKVKNNFENYSIKEKKQIFISNLVPIILSANQDILNKRELFFKIEKKVKHNNLNVLEAAILKKLFNEYNVKNDDLSELKKRIDIVPISLVIAQAAIESGWGTSRFALEGNAYFGQKIIGRKANGIKPNDIDNPLIKVKKFETLDDSVKSYLKNLNTHFAYKNFRKSRNELRSFGKVLEGDILANQLIKYSELGDEYVTNLHKIIKKNNLSKFDFIDYRTASR